MARKRMIDPGLWTNEQVNTLSREARLLFIGMVSNADDEGRLHGSARYLKANVFPYDEDLKAGKVGDWRDEVVKVGLALHYQVEGIEYLSLPTWHRHQTINRPYPSSLPSPEQAAGTFSERSVNAHGTLSERSSLIEEKGIEEKRREGNDAPASTSSLDDLNPLEQEVAELTSWGPFTQDDRAWLEEVLRDYKNILPADVRDCRDYWLAKPKKHNKAAWKTRLRNWFSHKAEWRKDGVNQGMPGNQPTGAFSGITS